MLNTKEAGRLGENHIMVAEPAQAEITESFIDANGIETHYWEHGPEDGSPVILIHGGGAGADAWGNYKFAIPLLADAGFRVYAMDMVGFGKSETPDPNGYTYDNQARIDQLAGFIEALEHDSANLVGNSMGGSASVGVSLQAPELVDKLVLVGGAGYRRDEEERKASEARREGALEVITAFDGTREAMYEVIDVLSTQDWYDRDSMVDHRLANWERDGVEQAHQAIMAIAGPTDDMSYPDAQWRQIEHETLLVYGGDDVLMGPEVPWAIFNLVDNSSLHILNNCGHWVMVDQIEQSAAIVSEFLNHG